MLTENCDSNTIDTFSQLWSRFDQSALPDTELQTYFSQYFGEFPWHMLDKDAVGADIGCGTGRWAKYVAPRVGRLHCIDASGAAVDVARKKLAANPNCDFHVGSLDRLPIPDGALDFAYCLGVLHYVPQPQAGLNAIVKKLKPGAPLLLYVYYALDDRPWWFRGAWLIADRFRRMVARAPFWFRYAFSQAVALSVYYPLARLARLLETFGMNVESIPLAAYRRRKFYTMRTDCLDRFANHLEHRFKRQQVLRMMEIAGLERGRIIDGPGKWVALGFAR